MLQITSFDRDAGGLQKTDSRAKGMSLIFNVFFFFRRGDTEEDAEADAEDGAEEDAEEDPEEDRRGHRRGRRRGRRRWGRRGRRRGHRRDPNHFIGLLPC